MVFKYNNRYVVLEVIENKGINFFRFVYYSSTETKLCFKSELKTNTEMNYYS